MLQTSWGGVKKWANCEFAQRQRLCHANTVIMVELTSRMLPLVSERSNQDARKKKCKNGFRKLTILHTRSKQKYDSSQEIVMGEKWKKVR